MDHRRPMPNMGGQFHGQGQGQGKQPASSGFSLMNIVPVYTLLVVGYAIYIWFKVKGRDNDQEGGEKKTPSKKSEIEELKDRLARTEAALNKLVEATAQLQKTMPEEELAKIFGEELGDKVADTAQAEKQEKSESESSSESESAEESDEEQVVETLESLESVESEEKSDSEKSQKSEDEPQVINIDKGDKNSDEQPTSVRKRLVPSDE